MPIWPAGSIGRYTERQGLLPGLQGFLIATTANPIHLFGCSRLGDSARSPDRLRAGSAYANPSMASFILCATLSLTRPSQSHPVALSISIYQVVQTSHITSWYPLSSASPEQQNAHPSPGWMQQMVLNLSITAGPGKGGGRGGSGLFLIDIWEIVKLNGNELLGPEETEAPAPKPRWGKEEKDTGRREMKQECKGKPCSAIKVRAWKRRDGRVERR